MEGVNAASNPRNTMGMELVPHRLTLDQYAAMIDEGILTEYDRVELIRGVIVDLSPQGDPHVVICRRLNRLLILALPEERAAISVASSLELPPDSMPEPDFAVHEPHIPGRGNGSNTVLAIEVSDSSLRYDRKVKMPLYAERGLRESWIVNATEQVVEVYRLPKDGRYTEVRAYRKGEALTPLAFPDVEIPVSKIFG